MTNTFVARVCARGTLDTAKYRYHYTETASTATISRIPIHDLGTTAALEPWEIVKTWKA